jgi:hypothetical protein
MALSAASSLPAAEAEFVDLPKAVVADRIQGGLLGQLLGNLNGLPHEMKYIRDPGQVATYTPALPEGARTDDDTDIEWTYVIEMERSGAFFVPPARIAELWRQHINTGIWSSNRYARDLMDLGLEPPLTGRPALNPWSHFNVAGQFNAECFGLAAPAMPQTAARLGLHYTHVAIDGEPAQLTQLVTAMIAVAFVELDVAKLVVAGRAAVDPASEMRRVVDDALAAWKQHPADWHAYRKTMQDRYMKYGGERRDFNAYPLNSAAILGALLYGRGDFVESLRLAFNLGYDADCNAATVGTVIGVIRGRRWMDSQGWIIKDVYRNTTRPGLPTDETITGFGRRIVAVARKVLTDNGGQVHGEGEKAVWRIRRQAPANVEPLPQPLDRMDELRAALLPQVRKDLAAGSPQDRARAAYLALCLGEAGKLKAEQPRAWSEALAALRGYPSLHKQMAQGGADPVVAERFKALAAEVGAWQTPGK